MELIENIDKKEFLKDFKSLLKKYNLVDDIKDRHEDKEFQNFLYGVKKYQEKELNEEYLVFDTEEAYHVFKAITSLVFVQHMKFSQLQELLSYIIVNNEFESNPDLYENEDII